MMRRFSRKKPEKRDLTFADVWKRGMDLSDARTAAGEPVTYDTAMSLTAVYAAIRLLSDTIASLPVDIYFRRNGTENVFRPLPQWVTEMNPTLRNHEVLGQSMTSLLLDGNAYLATLRDPTGTVLEITPLDPTSITPKLEEIEGRKVLTFRSSLSPDEIYTQRDITHIRGLMKPGTIVGLSPIRAAREMIGLGLGAQRFGSAFFGNGGLPGAMIEVPGQLSDEGIQQLKASWNSIHQGAGNAHKLSVLTEGAKFAALSVSNEDSQFLQTRSSTVADVARLYGVPSHLLADNSGAASMWGSGLHEQNVAFSMYSLRPYISRLESGITTILRSSGIAVAYARLDVASLSRGTSERWGNYQQGILSGVYSIDEVRELEGLPPLPNGEGSTHYVPMNMMPVGQTPTQE
jgi:HK97 family phage portal protein